MNALIREKLKQHKLIVIGASTGGTDALKDVLSPLPPTTPPIVIAQHILPGYTKGLARTLNNLSDLTIKEAEHGEIARVGHAYIAPGNMHIGIVDRLGDLTVVLKDTETVNLHKPSVEVLFLDASKLQYTQVLAIILTGMGKDGAQAFPVLEKAGAYTIAQNEESSVVFGMPKAAIATGAVKQILDLNGIVKEIKQF